MNHSTLEQAPTFRQGPGLTTRFAIAIILLTSTLMGLITFVLYSRIRVVMLEQIKIRGMTIAGGLADNAAEAMAAGDRLVLAELVDKAVKQEKSICLVALVDDRNVVLAHSDYTLEDKKYPEHRVISRETVNDGSVALFLRGDEPCLDFAVPIRLLGGAGKRQISLGTAHVVYWLSPLLRVISQMLIYVLIISILGILVGVVVIYFLVKRITKPIRKMAEAAETIGSGNLDVKVDIKNRDELGQLANTFNHMTTNLKHAQAEMIIKERMAQEMEVARSIQNILIPKETPDIAGYSIGMLYRSAREVSGDYLDFIEVGKGSWGMTVADVSGKGVPGGLVMAQTRSTLRSVAPRLPSPGQTLIQTNQMLFNDLRDDMFVTMNYAVLESKKHCLTLVRAGHPGALHYTAKTGHCREVMPKGVAVGITDPEFFAERLEEAVLELQPGDVVLMYTDGLDESCDGQDQLFGKERIIACLEAVAGRNAQEIIRVLDGEIKAFVKEAPQHDDMTVIVLKRETK